MRVLTVAGWLLARPLHGQAESAGDPALTARADGPWRGYQGGRVSYVDRGPVSAVPIPLAAFVSGFDKAGGVPVEGQPSNASAVPEIPGYSDMWRIRLVQVDDRFEPGSYRDYRRAMADAQAGRFRLTDPGVYGIAR